MHAERIRAVQVTALRRSFPFALGGSVVSAGMTGYAMCPVIPPRQVIVWLIATMIVAALRLAAMLYYDRTRGQPQAAARWLRHMFIGNLASGTLWGLPFAYWTFFVPIEYQLFFIVILFGLGTGAIYSNYMILPVIYAFEVPAFAPPFVALAAQPTAINLALVTGGLAYLIATLAFIHRMHRTHLDALRLSYENLALLEQVRREKEAAERSDLEKSRFLAAASHDLRQPVHAISLFLGLLSKERLSSHALYLVQNIASATAAMGNLFDALLNISRLDAGVVQVRRQSFALNTLLDQIRMEYAPQAQEKGLSMRVRSRDVQVQSDPVLLERVIRNLVSNAIVHTETGRVLVGCRVRDGHVRIEVWDTGPGIPAREEERVFWEFHQLRNPERDRSKGLGLGLAIVRRTTALLGHTLALRSVEGKGTVFSLCVERGVTAALPVQPPTLQPHTPESGARARDAATAQGQLVLVVDDDPQNREGLTLLLKSWGYRVIDGSSGANILEKVVHLTQKPALIVSDYRLPERETGIQVIDRLRDEYNDSDIPALIVSGDTDPSRLIDAAENGIPLLHKPVDVEMLRNWIERLLRHSHA
ncbi:hybrid sensor histidine kinase/response regulator [Paraburkholderia agricolaris]|uniref:ATP-binding response regulator n=1 Tax=Paraburkholderia agricolaris TaxID=2152888 RepID=UPI001290E6C4|nr:hybrid sensor histidine kinase/response regulator [Paraburkholderia agricolaris]